MQQKLFKYSWLCVLGTLFVACSTTPDGILTRKQMVAVQVDMMKAQALCDNDRGNLEKIENREALYRSVFEKHGITQAYYDSSLVWYARNLEVYMKVCDKVDAVISKEQKALGDIQAAALSDVRKDSADVWPRRPSLAIENTSIFTGTTFNIKPEESYPSGSVFIFKAAVWGLNQNLTQLPMVCMTAVQPDTLVTVSAPIRSNGSFSLELHTVATKKVKSVYGYIFMNNRDSALYHKIYLDKIELMRVNYGRISKNAADSTAVEKHDH